MNEKKEYFLKYILLPFLVWTGLVAFDQLTKYIVRAGISPGEVKQITPFFELTNLANTGMAFSMLQGANAYFMIFSAAVLAGLAVWFVRNASVLDKLVKTAVVLVASGAAGNLIDRAVFGRVTDFLDVYIGRYHWPSFNVADSCISIGGMLLFLWMLKPSIPRH